MTFKELVQKNYAYLTKSEKKICDFIATSNEKFINSTMNDVKKETNVGDATIIRFCQKLGFSGFTELKIAIAKEDFFSKITTDEQQYYYNTITDQLSTIIKKTENLINIDNVNTSIDLISKANNIYIFGSGTSSHTANDLETMLLRVGIQSKSINDPHFQAQVTQLLTNKDLIIALSLSGKTKDIYDALLLAKKANVKILSITNYLSSPIAELSDIILQTCVDEFFDGGSIGGKISQLYICDILIKGYELKNMDSINMREKVLRSIIDKRME